MHPALVWFRLDLRLADNPALAAAVSRGLPVVPVFLWCPEEDGAWAPGGASRWWLHHSLAALDARLARAGSRLIVRRGPALEALLALARETGARAVFWNRGCEPAAAERGRLVERGLAAVGISAETAAGGLLHDPAALLTKAGTPYQVFSPFWREIERRTTERPMPEPARIPPPEKWPASLALDELALLPRPDWAGGLRGTWKPGESGAHERLHAFLGHALAAYPEHRDRPDLDGVSMLSPHLHFGEIGPRQVWDAVWSRAVAGRRRFAPAATAFLRQLAWREFAHHLLHHFPATAEAPLRPGFAGFPWREDSAGLRAWQGGRTGYPIVDAGMRQLWRTGWMHNRVRMVAASFLVKDLLVHWREGALWFWDTLVDADLANNTLGWQWVAGCGADAAPYFRVFNPAMQGEKFDPNGDYVRRWVPELGGLPPDWIHRPWDAPPAILSRAKVSLGETYPRPIVDHARARERALAALARAKPGAHG